MATNQDGYTPIVGGMCKQRDDAHFIKFGGIKKMYEGKTEILVTMKGDFFLKTPDFFLKTPDLLNTKTQVWFAKDDGKSDMIGPFALAEEEPVQVLDSEEGEGEMQIHLHFGSKVEIQRGVSIQLMQYLQTHCWLFIKAFFG